MSPLLLRPLGSLVITGCVMFALGVRGQNAFSPGGNNYHIAGILAGDQTAPHATITASGGYVVWQDNDTDGNGLGIRAARLDGNLNKLDPVFRVNFVGVGDQEKPQVAALANGGAVFVWQGGPFGFQKIYARFLPPTGTNFSTADILVNTYTNDFQVHPSVATLADGGVVVVWSSFGQDGYFQGVYGRLFTAAGVTNGPEFQINQFFFNNQRTPTVAALSNGGFVVSWVSELQRGAATVDIYARRYNSAGVPAGNEFAVNTVITNLCANPSVAASPDGGFAVGWSQRDISTGNNAASQFTVNAASELSLNSWDVFARVYNANNVAVGLPVRMNSMTYGDQFAPKLASFGKNYLATWVGLGQDGSREGIFGQFLSSSAELAGVEFGVNTDNGSRQINPTVCSDNYNRFLVSWASYTSNGSFELFAREYDLIRVNISSITGGARISWNTRVGSTYQVQSSANYTTWTNHGAPRVATGLSDYIDVFGGVGATGYRVVRIQ